MLLWRRAVLPLLVVIGSTATNAQTTEAGAAAPAPLQPPTGGGGGGGGGGGSSRLEVFIALDICLRWAQYMDMANGTWGADVRALGWDYRFFTFLNPSCIGGDGAGGGAPARWKRRSDLVTIDRARGAPAVILPWTKRALPLHFPTHDHGAGKTLALVRYGMEWGLAHRPTATHVATVDSDSFLCPAAMGCILSGLPRSNLVWARLHSARDPDQPEKSFFAFSRDVALELVHSFGSATKTAATAAAAAAAATTTTTAAAAAAATTTTTETPGAGSDYSPSPPFGSSGFTARSRRRRLVPRVAALAAGGSYHDRVMAFISSRSRQPPPPQQQQQQQQQEGHGSSNIGSSTQYKYPPPPPPPAASASLSASGSNSAAGGRSQAAPFLHVVDDGDRLAQEASYKGCWPLRKGLAARRSGGGGSGGTGGAQHQHRPCGSFCRFAVHAHVKNQRSLDRDTGFFWLHAQQQKSHHHHYQWQQLLSGRNCSAA